MSTPTHLSETLTWISVKRKPVYSGAFVWSGLTAAPAPRITMTTAGRVSPAGIRFRQE